MKTLLLLLLAPTLARAQINIETMIGPGSPYWAVRVSSSFHDFLARVEVRGAENTVDLESCLERQSKHELWALDVPFEWKKPWGADDTYVTVEKDEDRQVIQVQKYGLVAGRSYNFLVCVYDTNGWVLEEQKFSGTAIDD